MIKEYRKLKKDKMLQKRMVSKGELKMRKAERREKKEGMLNKCSQKEGKEREL